IKIKKPPRVNCKKRNNKVFYLSQKKINKTLSYKNNTQEFEYIHKKNKYKIVLIGPLRIRDLDMLS
ncbi:hypothetical protein, partial [Klebsiella pneumoniae]|uniref:hypothetical protein n=1 Tax=Klebsiella pneumoniae TaxID=573 RepID=UPI0027317A0C